jgi:thiol-disulfide isomerase/thioredoxin
MIMYKYLFIIAALITTTATTAQNAEVTRDANGKKILKGFVTRQELASDTAFAWYAQNLQGYTPYAAAVEAFRGAKDSVYVLAFGGTWCGDTHSILPKVLAVTAAAGVPENHITLLGVDRAKTTVHGLEKAFNVTRVPTFIVLKDGKEVGRVVEYGKLGMVEKELGEIVSAAFKK